MQLLREVEEILQVAVRAPSGGNSQPWRFIATNNANNELHVINLPDKDFPLFNTGQKGSFVAHGALIENIVIAASKKSLGTRIIEVCASPLDPNLVAKIIFEKENVEVHPLYEYIMARCTNRKPYCETPLTSREQGALEDASACEGIELLLVNDSRAKAQLGQAVAADLPIVMAGSAEVHERFFQELVWTEEEERRSKSGLYVRTMELSTPQRVILKALRNWKLMKAANSVGLPKAIAKSNGSLWAHTGAFAALVITDNSPSRYVSVGRIMQRIWLQATALGLSIHLIEGVVFLMEGIRTGNSSCLSAAQVDEIQKAYRVIEKAFGIQRGVVALLFRVGHGAPPTATCSRMDPCIEIISDAASATV